MGKKYPMKPKAGDSVPSPETPAATVTPAAPEASKSEPAPARAIIPDVMPRGSLLRPVEDIEDTVAAFKLYQELKERLLDETDYTWFVRYIPFGSDREKFEGFRIRKMAEDFIATNLKGVGELEKKVKKSGCLKLSKAFAISTKIINAEVQPGERKAFYRVEAEAPNGQTHQRTGYCDGAEPGKAKAPFDTIDATALTRASDRAIMALLGGENTAEEFESNPPPVETKAPVQETKAPVKETKAPPAETPPPSPPPPPPDPAKQAMIEQILNMAGTLGLADRIEAAICERFGVSSAMEASIQQLQEAIDHLDQKMAEEPPKSPAEMTEDQLKNALEKKFQEAAPPDPTQDRTRLTKAIFAMANDAGYESEAFKENVKQHFQVASFTDLTIEQLHVVIARLEEKMNDPLARKPAAPPNGPKT